MEGVFRLTFQQNRNEAASCWCCLQSFEMLLTQTVLTVFGDTESPELCICKERCQSGWATSSARDTQKPQKITQPCLMSAGWNQFHKPASTSPDLKAWNLTSKDLRRKPLVENLGTTKIRILWYFVIELWLLQGFNHYTSCRRLERRVDSWREEQLLRRDTEANVDEKINNFFWNKNKEKVGKTNIKPEDAFDREPWDQEV